MKIKTITFGAAILALSPAIMPSEAQARQMCRDYTKTSWVNGRLHTGTAQACTYDQRYWNVTSINAPIEQRSYLVSMIERDVFDLGGIKIEFSNVRNYSAPVIYNNRFTETRVRHVPVPVYTNRYSHHPHKYDKRHHNKHNAKYDRHDRHDWRDDRRDHNDRNAWRDDKRGFDGFKSGRIQHPHAHLARP